MRTWLALLPLLLLPPAASAAPLLVGVAPDLPGSWPGDEGFAVGSDAGFDLTGYKVTDGEGTWAFSPGTHVDAGGTIWVVGNLETWSRFQGPQPAIALSSGAMSGSFQLGNDGDGIRLLDPTGHTVDAFAWGHAKVAGMEGAVGMVSPGMVYLRDRVDGPWVDSDQAHDWVTPRIHRIGESALDQPTFTVSNLTLYASPDSSFQVLSDHIGAARLRLHLHVYELRSASLVDLLVAAKHAHPGLDLQVFVEENPVGQTASERHATADALRSIQAAGGTVTLAGPGRYDDFHLKVLLADDTVAVQSENWVESGVPEDPTTGNRGWGIAVRDAALAGWFSTWMEADRMAWDAAPFNLTRYDPLYEPVARLAPRTGEYGPVAPAKTLAGTFQVTPIVAPDHTQDPRHDPLAALIGTATRLVAAQQLDLATTASNRLSWISADPLAQAFAAAAGRGTNVRVQAAAAFSQDDPGNRGALDDLAAQGVAVSVMARPGIQALHNKGLLVDDAAVVGSMNGNHHSRSANREVDLLVRGPGVAAYYLSLFDADWDGQARPPDASVIGRDLRALPAAPVPTLLVALAVVVVRSRSRP